MNDSINPDDSTRAGVLEQFLIKNWLLAWNKWLDNHTDEKGIIVMGDSINPDDSARADVTPAPAPTGEVGINITKLAIGTSIMVETEDSQVFEIVVRKPEHGVVEVSGTEPRLKNPTLGVLTHSSTDDKKTQIDHWIGQYLRMMIVFRNGNYESQLVTHASLKGEGWQFEVF